MGNVIIGVHGLGNKPASLLLERWWKLALTEGLRTFGYNSVLPQFRIAYWADILHEKCQDPDEKNPDSPYFLDEKYVEAPEYFPVENFSTRKKVMDFLGKQMNRIFLNEDLSLNYSFISDTIINRYFKDLEIYYTGNIRDKYNQIKRAYELIRNRLHKLLKEHKDDNIMLIGHSMGSIIAFDVMTFLAPDIKINTFITMGAPLGLPVVISKIAAEQRQRGIIQNKLCTPPAVIKNWFNFSDILDKIALNYKLSDNYSENQSGVKPVDIHVINNYEIDGIRNPHKSFGYLRTPEFSKILNEFIVAEKLSIKQKVSRRINIITNNLKSLISTNKN